jgi:hypothetical protein
MKFEWEGEIHPKEEGKEAIKSKGKIEIPYIGEENEPHEFEIKYSFDNKGKEHDILHDFLKEESNKFLKENITNLIFNLKKGGNFHFTKKFI